MSDAFILIALSFFSVSGIGLIFFARRIGLKRAGEALIVASVVLLGVKVLFLPAPVEPALGLEVPAGHVQS